MEALSQIPRHSRFLERFQCATIAILVACSAATIKAQDADWRQKLERAKESIAAGRYDEAAMSAAEAMNLVNRASTTDARLPITINLLAVAKHLQGRFSEAEGLYQDAIAAWRTQSDPSARAAIASSLFNLAQIQLDVQKYDAAERSLTEVEAIRGDEPTADLPNPEDVLSFFALVYQAKGLVTEAEASANRAVSLALSHVGISPEQIAIAYNSRGRILLVNGRYNEAALSFRESLDWAVRAHLAQTRTDSAQPLLTKGLQILDRALGPGSVASAEGLVSLGYLYTLDGKFGLAKQTLNRALTIHEAAFGKSNARLVPILNRCAAVRVYTNRDQEALIFLSRSLDIARGIPWLQATFATTLRDRAFVEARMGRIDEAEQDYKNAITAMESLFGAADSRLVPTLEVYVRIPPKDSPARLEGCQPSDQASASYEPKCAAIGSEHISALAWKPGQVRPTRPRMIDVMVPSDPGLCLTEDRSLAMG